MYRGDAHALAFMCEDAPGLSGHWFQAHQCCRSIAEWRGVPSRPVANAHALSRRREHLLQFSHLLLLRSAHGTLSLRAELERLSLLDCSIRLPLRAVQAKCVFRVCRFACFTLRYLARPIATSHSRFLSDTSHLMEVPAWGLLLPWCGSVKSAIVSCGGSRRKPDNRLSYHQALSSPVLGRAPGEPASMFCECQVRT